MADSIFVVAEQREGKLSRASFETIAGAQAISKETGWPVEVVLLGDALDSVAAELAAKNVARVYALESPTLAAYTSDAYVFALKSFLSEKQPKLVLMPHTYQVRDFAPRLALALDRTLISDAVSYKSEAGKMLFTRQMFQGKFAADVSFIGDTPWLVTFQIGAFRGDLAEAGQAPIEKVPAAVADGAPRVTPHEIFQEAKDPQTKIRLNGTSYMLLEFDFQMVPPNIELTIFQLLNAGITPATVAIGPLRLIFNNASAFSAVSSHARIS